ncbi:hypothetical protein C5S36_10025 [Candidatus Methanophagaceae archaeon]|nr:hypothetical protein C5S36_10025 [Methanophagales archaeon]
MLLRFKCYDSSCSIPTQRKNVPERFDQTCSKFDVLQIHAGAFKKQKEVKTKMEKHNVSLVKLSFLKKGFKAPIRGAIQIPNEKRGEKELWKKKE